MIYPQGNIVQAMEDESRRLDESYMKRETKLLTIKEEKEMEHGKRIHRRLGYS